jgi:flagellar FliL protein
LRLYHKNQWTAMAKNNPEIPSEPLNEDGQVPQKSSLKKWLILGALGFILLAAGGGAAVFFLPEYMPEPFNFFDHKAPKGTAAHKKPPEEERGHIYIMDPFIVNLADAEQSRFLKIRINLESKKPEPNEEFAKKLPLIKDTILTILSQKKSEELFPSSGKEKLKAEMMRLVNPNLSEFKIKAVYFTEFVIQ